MCYLIEFSQWNALLPSHSMGQETGPEQQADGGTQGSRAQAFNTRLPCLRGACSVSLWVTDSASVCRGEAGGGYPPQPSLPLILTFLFSCWISASVTACLIWSYGAERQALGSGWVKACLCPPPPQGPPLPTSLNLCTSFSGSMSTGDKASSFSASSNTSMAISPPGNVGLSSSSSSVAYSPVCEGSVEAVCPAHLSLPGS